MPQLQEKDHVCLDIYLGKMPVVVSTISILITTSSEVLEIVSYIQYLVKFYSNFVDNFVGLSNKVNTMTLGFTSKPELVLRVTNANIQKLIIYT